MMTDKQTDGQIHRQTGRQMNCNCFMLFGKRKIEQMRVKNEILQ